MSRNDAQDFADRLYSRIPSQYRVLDEEQGLPLRALMQVVGEQAANLRQDLDDLWDNFFIETCDDWVVPYIAALVGTNLLANPVGQSNRLDVRNTVLWRRSKGSPRMLQSLAESISGWPVSLVEFFQTLGWSQNVNHLRLDHLFTANLRDPYALSLLGLAGDPFAHHAEFKPARSLDQARVTSPTLGIGRAAWGTPGRYQIRTLGFFMRRLNTFAVRSSMPASELPGAAASTDAACFTFDPLFRNVPLFVQKTGEALTREAFNHAPGAHFGTDVAVKQSGVLLAIDGTPEPDLTASSVAFTFNRATAVTLHSGQGMRLADARPFRLAGGINFIVSAEWHGAGPAAPLGALSTFYAAHGISPAFNPAPPAASGGALALTVQLGRSGLGWAGPPPLPASPAARFPGAVVAVRRQNAGAPRVDDALYVYLPPVFLTPGDVRTYFVADDGSTYSSADLNALWLARPSEGQVYPPRVSNPSTATAEAFTALNRGAGGVELPDPSRFGAAQTLVTVNLFTGAFQPLGAVATVTQSGSAYPDLDAPATWPAFTYAPSRLAMLGNLPDEGLLAFNVRPLSGDFVPAFELILQNRAGGSLLVHVAQSEGVGAEGKDYLVADDGSTYDPPSDRTTMSGLTSYSGLALARASSGQVRPVAGVLPLQHRRPVALDLCRCERRILLMPGELGIDPELGRFAFAENDPAIGEGGLTVDYVEAFSDRVGARTFDRQLDPSAAPQIVVSRSGDSALTGAPVHTTVEDAMAAAQDGDIIEIVDSSTYASPAEIVLNAAPVRNLTLRAAAGQRPCLTFYSSAGTPAAAGFRIDTPMKSLELDGLLISGGPLWLDQPVERLALLACTLDPGIAGSTVSLVAMDENINAHADFLLCRCISGAIRTGRGISHLTVADSIVAARDEIAIGARTVQLERATIIGGVRCEVLHASECLLNDIVTVEDRQAGCIRFSRYEIGSVLPRKYQCIPTEAQARECGALGHCLPPLFNSMRFGRPDYLQLAAGCPPEILTASEAGAEVGSFAGALNTVRIQNVRTKLREFMPVGLSAALIGES